MPLAGSSICELSGSLRPRRWATPSMPIWCPERLVSARHYESEYSMGMMYTLRLSTNQGGIEDPLDTGRYHSGLLGRRQPQSWLYGTRDKTMGPCDLFRTPWITFGRRGNIRRFKGREVKTATTWRQIEGTKFAYQIQEKSFQITDAEQ